MKTGNRSTAANISWPQIRQEFNESFGYLRDDISRLRESKEAFGYTATLLICCTCDCIAWHKDIPEYKVLGSLLPSEQPYPKIAEKMFEALRNGLAHRFRPNTLSSGRDQYRFAVDWRSGRHLKTRHGDPNWIFLDLVVMCSGALSAIEDFQKELKESAAARSTFNRQHNKKLLTRIEDSANAEAWKSLMKKLEPHREKEPE